MKRIIEQSKLKRLFIIEDSEAESWYSEVQIKRIEDQIADANKIIMPHFECSYTIDNYTGKIALNINENPAEGQEPMISLHEIEVYDFLESTNLTEVISSSLAEAKRQVFSNYFDTLVRADLSKDILNFDPDDVRAIQIERIESESGVNVLASTIVDGSRIQTSDYSMVEFKANPQLMQNEMKLLIIDAIGLLKIKRARREFQQGNDLTQE